MSVLPYQSQTNYIVMDNCQWRSDIQEWCLGLTSSASDIRGSGLSAWPPDTSLRPADSFGDF